MKFVTSKRGFTLIELSIAMVVGGLVTGAIYSSFKTQQDNFSRQDDVVYMQQNLRAAMDIMTREIRMAGTAPLIGKKSFLALDADREMVVGVRMGAGILMANSDSIAFAMDLNGNGEIIDPAWPATDLEPGEVVAYGFGAADGDNNGIADAGAAAFGRNTRGFLGVGDVFQPGLNATGGIDYDSIAENINAVGFAYAIDSNGDGNLDYTDLAGVVQVDANQQPGMFPLWCTDTDGNGTWDNLDADNNGAINAADLLVVIPPGPPPAGAAGIVGVDTGILIGERFQEVRAVRIWMLARARNPDLKFSNTTDDSYIIGGQVMRFDANDHFRRRLLETAVDLRTMGLRDK